MQEKQDTSQQANTEQEGTEQQKMAQNPNPRANENIKNTTFDKNSATDNTPDVGSEITDGAAS